MVCNFLLATYAAHMKYYDDFEISKGIYGLLIPIFII